VNVTVDWPLVLERQFSRIQIVTCFAPETARSIVAGPHGSIFTIILALLHLSQRPLLLEATPLIPSPVDYPVIGPTEVVGCAYGLLYGQVGSELMKNDSDQAHGRVLTTVLNDNPNVTIESCIASCSALNHTLAGLEYSVQCMVSNNRYCAHTILLGMSSIFDSSAAITW
jgi:hypothetical protein